MIFNFIKTLINLRLFLVYILNTVNPGNLILELDLSSDDILKIYILSNIAKTKLSEYDNIFRGLESQQIYCHSKVLIYYLQNMKTAV